ncbi:MAG: NADP-dependent oxidoreductase [Gammaproteobacteria bacterium]|nr:NADP-dependent oxidoreductase [Gammaproteobacteria bacterium]
MAESHMQAIVIAAFGGPEVLELRDLPQPEPGPGELRIRVAACGVNPVDWKLRAGWLSAAMSHTLPLVPGCDLAGSVEATGEGVDPAWLGREVVAFLDLAHPGAYAQQAVAPLARVVERPARLEAAEAAALPTPGLTAMQLVRSHGRLASGHRLLVTGAAGAVGSLALQIAAEVPDAALFALVRESARQRLPKLPGLTVISDMQAAALADMDLVIDCVGGEVLARAPDWVARGGALISVVMPPDEARCQERAVRAGFVMVEHDSAQLAELVQACAHERWRLPVKRCLPLAEAAAAHRAGESGEAQGKMVLLA